MDCIFCKIINGDIPSYTIYEDDDVKVFLDINPNSNGHMLIIPKAHTLDFDSIDRETLNKIMTIASKMKKLVEDKLNPQGITFVQNNGCAQEVKHYHLHLIPVYDNKEKKPVEEIYNILKK